MNRPALCSAILAAGLLLDGTPAPAQGLFKSNKSQSSSNSGLSFSPSNRPSSMTSPGTPSRATSSARSSGSKDGARYDNGKAVNNNSRSSARTPKNKAVDPPVSKAKPHNTDSAATKTKSRDTDSVATKTKSKDADSRATKTKSKDTDSVATKTGAKDADSFANKKPKGPGSHADKGKGGDALAKHKAPAHEAKKNTALGLADSQRSKIPLGQSTKDLLVKGTHENYPSKRPGDSDTLRKAASGSRLSQSEVDRLIDIRNDPKVSSKTRGAIDTAIIQNQKQALLQAAAGAPTTGGTAVVSGIPAGNQGNLKPFLGGMVVGSILQGFMNSNLLSGGVPGGAGLDPAAGFDPGGFDPVLLPPSAPGEDEPEEP